MPHIKAKTGIQWHYDVEGEGERLVLIHGWGVDKRIWKQQIKFFSQHYRVVSFDLPGHGKSTWINVPLKDMAQDVGYMLQMLNVNKAHIIGSSLGGLLALKLYSISPEKFNKLVLVGSMPKFSKSADYPFGLDVERIRKLSGQLDTAFPSIVDVFFRSLFTKEERASRRFKWLQKFRQTEEKPMKPALSEYLEILESEDLRDVLKNAQLPIQFINGAGDEICNTATVSFLRNMVPHAQFFDFEECGHFPFLSKPYEFNEIVQKFLKE